MGKHDQEKKKLPFVMNAPRLGHVSAGSRVGGVAVMVGAAGRWRYVEASLAA